MSDNGAYRGNPLLKRVGEQMEWTPELIQEYIKCKNDPIYFCENYVKIVHVDKGLVNFELYDYQKEIIESMTNNRATIVTASRQCGKSTTFVGFSLHFLLFNSDKTLAILANKAATAREILGRVQKAYQYLPKWLQHGIVEFNKGSFTLENGSKAIAAATSADSIRGLSINVILIDECAFVEGWDSFSASTLPTISSGKTTKIILISTPNGLNHFHAIYQGALAKQNNYHPIMVTWDKVPGRDEAWKQRALQELNNDQQKFDQEYACAFLGSSGTLIGGDTLKNLVAQVPVAQEDSLKVYEKPIKGHQYVITADVSEGKGLDYSAFNVIDITKMPYKQVCVFRSNLYVPSEYADVLIKIGMRYNEAQILVENNNSMGNEINNLLFERGYENIIYTENGGLKGKRVSNNPTKGERGLRTTASTKAKGCSVLKLLIEGQQLIINDHDTIWELSRFSRKGRSYEAEEGATDDIVMSLVVFAWLTTDDFFINLADINTVSELRDMSEAELEEKIGFLGFNGLVDYDEPEVYVPAEYFY